MISVATLLGEWFGRRRFAAVFASLLLTLIAAPVAAEYQFRSGPVELLLFLSLVAASFGGSTPRQRPWLTAFVLVTAALRVAGPRLESNAITLVGALFLIALAVTAAVGALKFALRQRSVDSEHLFAAMSAYLLAGHLFGIGYAEVEAMRPGSFLVAGAPSTPEVFDLQSSIYFSFVTLATLGYGDIAPVTSTARGMAISEAILGQFYLAVLVARLVGLGAALGSREEHRLGLRTLDQARASGSRIRNLLKKRR